MINLSHFQKSLKKRKKHNLRIILLNKLQSASMCSMNHGKMTNCSLKRRVIKYYIITITLN